MEKIATFKIDRGADLADMFGGQTEYEVAVWMNVRGETPDLIGAGHTVAEAVAEARAQLKAWRALDAGRDVGHPLGMLAEAGTNG